MGGFNLKTKFMSCFCQTSTWLAVEAGFESGFQDKCLSSTEFAQLSHICSTTASGIFSRHKYHKLSKYLSGTLSTGGWLVRWNLWGREAGGGGWNNSIGKSAPGRPHSSTIVQPTIALQCIAYILHCILDSNASVAMQCGVPHWNLHFGYCEILAVCGQLQCGRVQDGAANFEHPLIRITHTSGHHPTRPYPLSSPVSTTHRSRYLYYWQFSWTIHLTKYLYQIYFTRNSCWPPAWWNQENQQFPQTGEKHFAEKNFWNLSSLQCNQVKYKINVHKNLFSLDERYWIL